MKESVKKLAVRLENFFCDPKAPRWWEWVILSVLILIPFLSYFYGDTMSIINYEVNFMGAIVNYDGWTSYYEYIKYLVENDPFGFGSQYYAYATYDFPMYILLGIWGIPLWIFWGSKGLDVNASYVARIYGKSVLLVGLVICIYLVYSICRELKLTREHSLWGGFLFASSIFVFTAIGLNGQTDILGMVFTLLGFRAYVRRKRAGFLLWFMVAVMCKMYAFFMFVPLLLLAEKKLWKLGASVVAVWSLKVVQAFIFHPGAPAMINKREFEVYMYNRMIANKLPFVNGDVPTVIVMIAVVCVYCYLHKEITEEEEFFKYAVWVAAASMVCFFVSFESSAYWYLNLCPYLAILLVYNSANCKNNFLFETLGLAALVTAFFGTRPWTYEIYACHDMLLERFFGNYNDIQGSYLLEEFASDVHIVKFAGALNAAFVVLLLAFVWENRPVKIRYAPEKAVRGYGYARLFVNVAVAFVPLLLFIYNLLALK